MDARLQEIFDRVPEDKPRSRLEPYREVILRWRRQGRSFRRIQQILADECRVHVTHETLRRFIKRRNRPRTQQTDQESELRTSLAPVRPEAQPAAAAAGEDPWAEARERIRKLKAEPPPAEPKKLFVFTEEDAIRPYVLKKEEKK